MTSTVKDTETSAATLVEGEERPGSGPASRRTFARARAWLRPSVVLVLAAVLFAVPFLVTQASTLRMPCVGEHLWRAAATYSVAYNYAHTSLNYFFPISDWREHTSGITGMEPPTYPYLCGLLMKVLGDTPAIGRVVNYVAELLALGTFVWTTFRIERPLLGAAFLVAWCLSPGGSLEFRQYQPDAFLTSWLLVAACFFHLHARFQGRREYLLGLAAFFLAAGSKPNAIAVAPAMFLFAVVGGPKVGFRGWLSRALPLAVPVGLVVVWQRWAHHLWIDYAKGWSLIEIQLPLEQALADLKNPSTTISLFSDWLPRHNTGWLGFPLLVIGLCIALFPRQRALSVGFLVWLAGMYLITAVVGRRVANNLYYMTAFLPACVYFEALALESVLSWLVAGRASLERRWAAWAVLGVGIVAWYWDATKLTEPLAPKHFWLVDAGPLRLVLVFVLAFFGVQVPEVKRAFARWPGWSAWPALAAALLVFPMAWSVRTTIGETLLARVKDPYWSDPDARIAELREAVNRFTTRNDRIMVDVMNPAMLQWPLRFGYAWDPGIINGRMAERGTLGPGGVEPPPRILIHYKRWASLPQSIASWTPVADSPDWSIYCIDPNGCPPR